VIVGYGGGYGEGVCGGWGVGVRGHEKCNITKINIKM